MTRAKERLWLTSANMRTLYGKTDFTRESQFLREVDKHLIDGDAIFEKKTEKQRASLDGCARDKPFDPFAGLKYVKRQVKEKTQAAQQFVQGDEVVHPKFGRGTVEKTDGKVIQVAFSDGSHKKLAAGIAPLTKYKPKED